MADFTDSKSGVGGIIHDNAIEVEWSDAEALITPDQVRNYHLFGIPLVSALKDPVSGRPAVLDNTLLKMFIERAVSLAELEVGADIFPRQYKERAAYDLPEQNSFGFMKTRHRPVASIEKLAITSSDGVNVWDVPLAWIETGYLHQGQINLIPFAVSAQSGTTIPVTSPVGMGLLPSLFKFNWVPSLWQVTYTSGWKDGAVPRVLNELVGSIAAMEVLSMLASTFARTNSSSLGIDGLSQSVSTPGPEVFNTRIQMLADKRKWLVRKIQRVMGLGLWSDNV